jgi:hypothetical protein
VEDPAGRSIAVDCDRVAGLDRDPCRELVDDVLSRGMRSVELDLGSDRHRAVAAVGLAANDPQADRALRCRPHTPAGDDPAFGDHESGTTRPSALQSGALRVAADEEVRSHAERGAHCGGRVRSAG